MTNRVAEKRFASRIRTGLNKGRTRGDINILFLVCDAPTRDTTSISYIADTAYAYSDVVAVPLISDLHKKVRGVDDPLFDTYLQFVETFIHDVEQLNDKPILGTIPMLPWLMSRRLCDLYVSIGVRAFCLDFAGRTPSATEERNFRPLLKRLVSEGLQEDVLFYALNPNTGRAARGLPRGVAPAQDILSFGFGFDVLGLKHFGLKGPREMYEALRQQPPSTRLFDKEAYAYRRVPLNQAESIFPPDSSLSPEDLKLASRHYVIQAIVNMEQHGLEANRVRQAIQEYAVGDYLKEKTLLQEKDRTRMRRAREDVDRPQESLERWF